MFNLVFGEFNCTKEEFKVTDGEKYTYYPQGKWISKQYLIEITEEFGEGDWLQDGCGYNLAGASYDLEGFGQNGCIIDKEFIEDSFNS